MLLSLKPKTSVLITAANSSPPPLFIKSALGDKCYKLSLVPEFEVSNGEPGFLGFRNESLLLQAAADFSGSGCGLNSLEVDRTLHCVGS